MSYVNSVLQPGERIILRGRSALDRVLARDRVRWCSAIVLRGLGAAASGMGSR